MDRLLITLPAETTTGGISYYFRTLSKYINWDVKYFVRGSRTWPKVRSTSFELTRAIWDLIRFSFTLFTMKYKLIQINTSLNIFSLVRDGFFVLISKLFRRKVLLFFHGWDIRLAREIELNHLTVFRLVFFRADAIIVLSSSFQSKLNQWGYKKNIYIETSIVDDDLVEGVTEASVEQKFEHTDNKINLLFLSRIEKEKGIFELINTFEILVKEFPFLELNIAGLGFEEENVKKIIANSGNSQMYFHNFVTGGAKRDLFTKSHIFCLPSYSEGLPISTLEAMSFGLPVVTSNVGGLKDVVIDNENGFTVEPKNIEQLIGSIRKLVNNPNLMLRIAKNNMQIANLRFKASIVIQRLDKIYKSAIDS